MSHPVFFSMGGTRDGEFAEEAAKHLPEAMVYCYRWTGEEGVSFRAEIERKIHDCRLFVVFWSADYLKSDHAKNELAQFKQIVERSGDGKQLMIIQRERQCPDIQGKWINPLNGKEESIFGRWSYERADFQPDAPRVADLVRRRLERAEVVERALVLRSRLQLEFQKTLKLPNFKVPQFSFVSGLEGDGRRTALRDYMRVAHVSLTARPVSFDSAEGPEDLLLRMLGISGFTVAQRQVVIDDIAAKRTTVAKEIRRLLHDASAARSYYVINLTRFSGVDSIGVPNWVSEVFGQLGGGNTPLAFMVTPTQITDARMQYFPHAKRVRVPGLDEDEMEELVHKLVAEDRDPNRWSDEHKQLVQAASGSSPSLCQAIMYTMSIEPSMDFLGQIAKRESEVFSANISALVGYLVKKFADRPGDILALRIIERLGLTSLKALEEIFSLRGGDLTFDLYQLMEYGLVERLYDDTYRVPPLIQRRLGDALWAASKDQELETLLEEFGKRWTLALDEYGAVYASNKQMTSLRVTGEPMPGLDSYLTTAVLFKAGLERYTSNDYPRAYSILSRAMKRIVGGTSIDVLTQLEIARYFGLAAAREEEFDDLETACKFIEGMELKGAKRATQGSAIVHFLHGFRARVESKYKIAVSEYVQARKLLEGTQFAERQRGHVLTELSRAYLRTSPPDFVQAIAVAKEAYELNKVVHNLSGWIRARIARLSTVPLDGEAAEIQKIEELIGELAVMCERSGQDFHLVRRADLQRVKVLYEHQHTNRPIDLKSAIDDMDAAYQLKRRFQSKVLGWQLRFFDQTTDYTSLLLSETSNVLSRRAEHDHMFVRHALGINALITARTREANALSMIRNKIFDIPERTRHYLDDAIRAKGSIPRTNEAFNRLERL